MSRSTHAARAVALTAIDLIRAESSRIGWPVRFRTDLRHDERAIRSRADRDAAGRSFGWAVGPDGTYFAWCLEPVGVAERHDHRFFRCVADTFPAARFYIFTPDHGLEPVATGADLDERLRDTARAARDDAARCRICEVAS